MKIKHLLILGIMAVLVSCGEATVTKTKIANESDSLAYCIGINLYSQLKQDSMQLNPMLVAKGMMEAKSGKATLIDNAAQGYLIAFPNRKRMEAKAKQEAMARENFKSNIQAGDSFLQANKTKPGVVVTESGLQYKVVKMGNGPKPAATDVVKVHYTGTLINGTKFDSSIDRGKTAQFPLNQVIKGWTEGVQLMPVGSKFIFYVPAELGYGSQQASAEITPYSTLIFEVELLDIVK